MNNPEPQDWHDAALEVSYRVDMLVAAKNPLCYASELLALVNAVGDLNSFLPGWDVNSGTMPWERDE